MTLRLEDKKAIVEALHKVADKSISALAVDYRGLSVADMTELRAKARDAGVFLQVVRNTLAKKALQDTAFACMSETLEGPLFLAFALEDPGAAARLIMGFAKTHENIKVKSLAIGGKLLQVQNLASVADLPTREQALAMLMGVMLAPISRFVRTLAEPYAKLTRTIAAIGEQKKTV